MKGILILLGFFIAFQNLQAQKINKEDLLGRWRINQKLNGDTLLLARKIKDSTFTEWNFDKEFVSISSLKMLAGMEEMICNSNSKLHWYLEKTMIIIKKEYCNDTFSIISLNSSSLKLKRISKADCEADYRPKNTNFYFRKQEAGSGIFSKDTLLLSEVRIDSKNPEIHLTPDNKFILNYNFRNFVIDSQANNMTITVIVDQIKGTWTTSDINKSVILRLDDGTEYVYMVIKKDGLIYWIKKKEL